MAEKTPRKTRAKTAGDGWFSRLKNRLWDDGVYFVALAVVPATLLPMLDWGAIALQLIVAGIVVFYVLRTYGRRPVVLAVVGVAVLTLSGTAALLIKSGNKYVVPVDDWSDSIFANAYYGPAGRFHVIPTNSLYPIKRLLLIAINQFDDRIIILDSFHSGDRVIAHSPTEIAAAALSGKEDGASGPISFPWRRDQFDLAIDPDSQYSFTVQSGGWTMSFISNLGHNTPGLFGISAAKDIDLEMWRRLAFSEETLRALPTVSSLDILEALGDEARRTGDWTDRLRYLTLQLRIVNERYPSQAMPGRQNVYELANIGNLRAVAEIFVSWQPTRALHDNPWFSPFSFELLDTAASVPAAQLNAGGREISWLIETLKKLSDVATDNSLAVLIDRPDDQAEDASDRARADQAKALLGTLSGGQGDAKTFADFFELIAAPDASAPLKTGADVRAEALVRANPDLDRDDVRQWVKSGGSAAGHRIQLLDDALMDVVAPRFGSLMRAIMSGSAGDSVMHRIDAEFSNLNRLSASLESLAPLIEDDDQRRVQEYSFAMSRDMFSKFGTIFDGMQKCASQNTVEEEACSADLFAVMPELAEFLQIVRNQDSATPFLSAYLNINPFPGLPYSKEDHRYLTLLTGSLYSVDPAPGEVARLCKDTADKADGLIEEGRITARATLLAVQAEALRRCGDPKAAVIDQLFVEKQMPAASWRENFGLWTLPPQPGVVAQTP